MPFSPCFYFISNCCLYIAHGQWFSFAFFFFFQFTFQHFPTKNFNYHKLPECHDGGKLSLSALTRRKNLRNKINTKMKQKKMKRQQQQNCENCFQIIKYVLPAL